MVREIAQPSGVPAGKFTSHMPSEYYDETLAEIDRSYKMSGWTQEMFCHEKNGQ
jgi:hypothetical protein